MFVEDANLAEGDVEGGAEAGVLGVGSEGGVEVRLVEGREDVGTRRAAGHVAANGEDWEVSETLSQKVDEVRSEDAVLQA